MNSHEGTHRIGHTPVFGRHHPHHQRPWPQPQRKRVQLSKPSHFCPPPTGGAPRTAYPPPSPPPRVHPQPCPPLGHTAESYLTRHCMASCTGSQMNLTPLTPMTSKNGLVKQPLPSSTHRPPAGPGCTWMAQRAPWTTDLRPPCFFRMAPDGCCAKRPRTSPQRDRSSGRLLCPYGGPLHLTHTSILPCWGTTSTLLLFSLRAPPRASHHARQPAHGNPLFSSSRPPYAQG